MGSTSDLPVMEKACKFLDDMHIPFEVNALSAHRTPDAVEQFAKQAKPRGIRVIIAGAGCRSSECPSKACSTDLTRCLASYRCHPEYPWQLSE